jgi:hypothetical protein
MSTTDQARIAKLEAENARLKTGDLAEAYNCGEQKVIELLAASNARIQRREAENADLKAKFEIAMFAMAKREPEPQTITVSQLERAE